MNPARNATPREAGFTLVEFLIVSLVGFIMVMGSYQVLISQSRILAQQQETIDARASSQGGAALLAWELKSLSAAGGDLYTITEDSIVVRSVQATGVICSWMETGSVSRLGLQETSGVFPGTANDSAMVYSVVNRTWAAFDVVEAWNGGGAWGNGVPDCFWGDSTTTEPYAAIQIDTLVTLVNVEVGGPVHVFRRTTYGLSTSDGRWWLSRREGTGAWEILTGPMLSPNNGGLAFKYYAQNDSLTADPTLVTRVEFTLRSQSHGQVSTAGQTGGASEDSVTTTVFLRNTS